MFRWLVGLLVTLLINVLKKVATAEFVVMCIGCGFLLLSFGSNL